MLAGWLSPRDTRGGSASGRAWRGRRSGKGASEEGAPVRWGRWEAQAEPSGLCHWHWGVRGARRNQDPESRAGGGRRANAPPASAGEGALGAELPQRPPGCFPTCCCFRLNACLSPPPYPGFSCFGF